MEFTEKDFQKILETQDFLIASKIISGKFEGLHIDAKSEPYKNDKKGRSEFCKDVSSFANSDGGIIIFPAKEESRKESLNEKITQLVPTDTQVNTKAFLQMVNDLVVPRIEGLDIVPIESAKGKFVYIVKIPKQNHENLPFLYSTPYINNEKVIGGAIGLFSRSSSNSFPHTATDLQNLIKNGRNNQSVLKKLSELESKLPEAKAQPVKKNIIPVKNKFKSSLEITINSNQPHELESFFVNGDSPVKKAIASPKSIRYGGWGIESHSSPSYEINPKRLFVLDSNREIIITSSGEVKAVFSVHDFLDHGTNEDFTINSLALTELLCNFGIFLNDLNSTIKSENYSVQIKFNNFVNHKLGIYKPEEEWKFKTTLPTQVSNDQINFESNNINALPYLILSNIFQWFGFNDTIPLTIDRNIDFEAIGKIN